MTNPTFTREELADYGKKPVDPTPVDEADDTDHSAADVAADETPDEEAEADRGTGSADAAATRAEADADSDDESVVKAAARAQQDADDEVDLDVGSALFAPKEARPKLSDPDVNFDPDLLERKMAQWDDRREKRVLRQAVAEHKLNESLNTKLQKGAATYKDWDSVVIKNEVLLASQLAPRAAVAVASSAHTADVLYAFGKDPELAKRAAKAPIEEQMLIVGKLIAKVEAEKRADRAAAAVRQPKTPEKRAPIVRTRASVLAGKESMTDFARRERTLSIKSRNRGFK